jgi:hypothetical protein
VFGQNAAPTDFPTSSSYLPNLFNTGTAGVAPILLRRGVTPGSPAQAQMAQATGQTPTMKESTLTGVLADFATLSDAGLIDLQKKLYTGGFYGSSYYAKHPQTPAYGIKDQDTLAAYSQAANLAAQLHASGMTLDEVITQGSSVGGGRGAGAGGPTRAPLTIQLTNPQDVHFVANKVGQTVLGRNLNDAELQAITASFQGGEATAQRAAYNTGVGGGTSTQAPSLQAFAEQQVRAKNPVEAGAHDLSQTFDTFLSLIAGGGK